MRAMTLGLVGAVAAALGLAACGGSGGDDGAGSPDEPPELAGIVAAHNAVRSAHGQGDLTWDPALAAIAAGWAAQCVDHEAPAGLIDHNPGRSDSYPEYVGENIFASGGFQPTGPQAVDSWADEEQGYDYDTNQCSGVCGHYTQIVWSTTTKISCAYHACTSLQFPNSIVCDYAPGGNVNGQRPY